VDEPGGGVTPGARLRARIDSGPILVVPGAYDALFGSLVQRAGFEAVYLTGSGVSYSTLAAPDIGLVTADTMAAKVRELSGVVDVPIIADGDTGYGDEANIARTVREYERGGAAAIQIEDQLSPKRCGHYAGKQVVEVEEMVARLHAALGARRDPGFMVIARTDAAIERGVDALGHAAAAGEKGVAQAGQVEISRGERRRFERHRVRCYTKNPGRSGMSGWVTAITLNSPPI